MPHAQPAPGASAPRRRAIASQALVPSGVQALPIEPPAPEEVVERLSYRNAGQYQAAVTLAAGYHRQARLAVERREASIRKAERQARVEQQETMLTHDRQLVQAQTRYKGFIEQAHAKHRQILHHARARVHQAESQYREALAAFPEFGACELRRLALQDTQLVVLSLQEAYQGVLGPDGLGDLGEFLVRLDKTIDLARERKALAALGFMESLVSGVLHRQVLRLGRHSAECDRLSQAANARLIVLRGLQQPPSTDGAPDEVRAIYQSVQAWLAQAAGTPFGLAIERLKREVLGYVRRAQDQLEAESQEAARRAENLQDLRPAMEAYAAAKRLLQGTEQAARAALQHELAKVDARLEKERAMIEALVVGMDHTASKRLEEARRNHQQARKLVVKWSKELKRLEALSGFQRFKFRHLEGFDAERFWQNFHARDAALD